MQVRRRTEVITTEEGGKAIRILYFSGKKEDWLMQTDEFMAKANVKGYDEILFGSILAFGDGCQEGRLSKEQVKANKLEQNSSQ